ncbi:hypothetical protein B4086_5720 [Bacillus cereus]|nr:hypothetical protein B4086_5720 [Bacillus cereus]
MPEFDFINMAKDYGVELIFVSIFVGVVLTVMLWGGKGEY